MSLSDWINGTAGSVANVATVAVANPQTPKTDFSEADHSGIESGQVATATPAALATHEPAELPADLIEAAAPTICCGDCQHGTATDHPAILTCGLGIPSGLPINGRWSTDRHGCGKYAAQQDFDS